jgi:hypothetical protein
MKILIKYFSFLLAAMLAAGPASADMLQSEILGNRWGSEVSTFQGLEKLWEKDMTSFYLRPDVNHTIYGVRIPSVVYGFYFGKFLLLTLKLMIRPFSTA